tara:strand:- start:1455 stop:1649 length:195 start_codon:yes stop_codon:yes gene_type:complete
LSFVKKTDFYFDLDIGSGSITRDVQSIKRDDDEEQDKENIDPEKRPTPPLPRFLPKPRFPGSAN